MEKAFVINMFIVFSPNRKSGGKTDTVHSKGKLPVVYEKAKKLHLSDL